LSYNTVAIPGHPNPTKGVAASLGWSGCKTFNGRNGLWVLKNSIFRKTPKIGGVQYGPEN
jgi:hypothetical protein